MSKPVKRGDRWRIQWVDHEGKRRSGTFATEAQARAAARRAEVERDDVRAGKARPRAMTKLAELVPQWLAVRPLLRRAQNRQHFDSHILPELGDLKLSEITNAVIAGFIRTLEAKPTARVGAKNAERNTLRPATIANVLITLRKFLNDHEHPVRIRYKVPTSGYAWIREPRDVGLFLEATGEGWFRVACELAVYGALRKGEIAGLRRDALDFERGIIRVDRSYGGPTKSRLVRWVPMAPQLARTLRAWVLSHPGELVVTRHGKPIGEKTDIAKPVRRACRRAGVESVNFHQLRHTCASHLTGRVSLPMVGAMLGHKDPKTTMRYAHLDSESLARDVRLHLDFTAPAGELVAIRSAPPVHQSNSVSASQSSKSA